MKPNPIETRAQLIAALINTGIKSDVAFVEHQIIPTLWAGKIDWYWRKYSLMWLGPRGHSPIKPYPRRGTAEEMADYVLGFGGVKLGEWYPLTREDLKDYEDIEFYDLAVEYAKTLSG